MTLAIVKSYMEQDGAIVKDKKTPITVLGISLVNLVNLVMLIRQVI